MFFSNSFICYSEEKNEYERHVNAPLFKRAFTLDETAGAKLTVCGLGFYRAFLNGVEITKGRLAPYVSNTDEAVYYDEYAVESFVKLGENELEILLGNGFQNPIGGEVWDLHKGAWRSAPKLACAFTLGEKLLFEADENFLVSPSKITFDDLWAGEFYDARLKHRFRAAKRTEPPKGEKRLSNAFKVEVKKEISPVAIYPYEKGFVYDFGVNAAGVCRLRLNASAGQKISLYHFEIFENGKIRGENIAFGKRTREGYWQRDEYITKDGDNVYEPSFTYHGFRYVYAEGLTEAQATKAALTMLIFGTASGQKLSFTCNDGRLNALLSATLNTDYANFLYYPTDCPQREKNGWTGDAMLSAEQMLLSMRVKEPLKEWLFCMRKAQGKNGMIPRIVPTGEWGYRGGESGPCWDGALVEIPYRIYEIEGDRYAITDNLPAMERYLDYLLSREDERGLLAFGLGDREETFSPESSAHATPNCVTDTLTAIGLCDKIEAMAKEVGESALAKKAAALAARWKTAARTHLTDGAKVQPFTQTGQCLALAVGLFEGEEETRAFSAFLELLEKDGAVKMGVIGYRYLFETLAERGQRERAEKLLLTERYTGYYYYVKKDVTSLPESFVEYEAGSFDRKDGGKAMSLNHHWYGHILGSVLKYVVGLRYRGYGGRRLTVAPDFSALESVEAETELWVEKIKVSWKKTAEKVVLRVKTTLAYRLDFGDGYELVGERELADEKEYALLERKK